MQDRNQHESAVIPMLVCHDAGAEIAFCKEVFGDTELTRRPAPDGSVLQGTLAIGPAMVMVHSEVPSLASRATQSDGSSPVVIYLQVADADQTVQRAVAAGARILTPLTKQFWGDRMGRITDPSGHVWNIASRIQKA